MSVGREVRENQRQQRQEQRLTFEGQLLFRSALISPITSNECCLPRYHKVITCLGLGGRIQFEDEKASDRIPVANSYSVPRPLGTG